MSLCPLTHLLEMESVKVHAEWKSVCCPSGTFSQTGVCQWCSAAGAKLRGQSGDFLPGWGLESGWQPTVLAIILTRQSRACYPSCGSCDTLKAALQLTRWLLVPALIWVVASREVAVPPDGLQARLLDAFCDVSWRPGLNLQLKSTGDSHC